MQDKVKGPGVGLLVTAGLGGLWAIVSAALDVLEIDLMGGNQTMTGYFGAGGAAITIVLTLINLAVCGFIGFGASKMMKLESWGLSLAACIVAMVPCFACCLIGMPMGIWGLIVLMKPEVKSAFAGQAPAEG